MGLDTNDYATHHGLSVKLAEHVKVAINQRKQSTQGDPEPTGEQSKQTGTHRDMGPDSRSGAMGCSTELAYLMGTDRMRAINLNPYRNTLMAITVGIYKPFVWKVMMRVDDQVWYGVGHQVWYGVFARYGSHESD